MYTIKLENIRRIVNEVFISNGLGEVDATTLTETLITADLRGYESHGLIRLPLFLKILQNANLKPKLSLKSEGPSYFHMDCDNGLGPVVVKDAIGIACQKAKESGICAGVLFNTNYMGMLTYYMLPVSEQNMIGMIMCNTPPFVAPQGGTERRVGTNPICFAIPTGNGFPLILDMGISPAVGKIRLALQKGEELPKGWALNKNGEPTTDPQEALDGVVLPVGGAKGYGLGLIVDIISGVLSGANFGLSIAHPLLPMEKPANLGTFMLVLDIERFMPIELFKTNIKCLINDVKSSKKATGVSEIMIPGESSHRNQLKWLERGAVRLSAETWHKIMELAEKYNVDY